MPQALRLDRLAAADRQCAAAFCEVLAIGRGILAQQHPGEQQYQQRFEHSAHDAGDGDARRTHDRQFRIAGKGAQTDQTTDQRGHRQQFIETPGNREQDIHERFESAIVALQLVQLTDIGEQQIQPHNDQGHAHHTEEDRGTDMPIKQPHGHLPSARWER